MTDLKYNPFSILKGRIAKRPARPRLEPVTDEKPGDEDQKSVFLEAMNGVEPLSKDRRAARKPGSIPSRPLEIAREDSDSVSLRKLIDLVLKGEGFSVADTPEYIEGTGYNIHPEITRRLHQGDFSVQAHLDLHGLNVAEAREVFDRFIKSAIYSSKRNVLVIHGRGLSSPGAPVLKNKVQEWLTRSRWRKWVIAFTSAASFDGGAGATYILLRDRPVAKPGRRKSS